MSEADLLWKLLSIFSVIISIASAIYSFRRQPSLDKELSRLHSREEASKCRDDIYQRINDDKRDLDVKVDQLGRSATENFANVLRAIGSLEGQMKVVDALGTLINAAIKAGR